MEATTVIRSVPGLDEAAIAAARQWEYEPTKVDGKPARVRLTVPITFALALPRLQRQPGVPDLRQGANPAWPAGASGGGRVTAEVTLEPDGRVGVARVLEGDAPWAGSLLAALRTWRFAPPPEEEVLSFRVEADFVAARGSDPARVDLKATGLQRSGLLGEPSPCLEAARPFPRPPHRRPPRRRPPPRARTAAPPLRQPPHPAAAPVARTPAPASPAAGHSRRHPPRRPPPPRRLPQRCRPQRRLPRRSSAVRSAGPRPGERAVSPVPEVRTGGRPGGAATGRRRRPSRR